MPELPTHCLCIEYVPADKGQGKEESFRISKQGHFPITVLNLALDIAKQSTLAAIALHAQHQPQPQILMPNGPLPRFPS